VTRAGAALGLLLFAVCLHAQSSASLLARQRAIGYDKAGIVLLLTQPDSQEAANAFRQAIQTDPQYKNAYLNLGIVSERRGEYDLALWAYRAYAGAGGGGPAVRARIAAAEQLAAKMKTPAGRREVEFGLALSRAQDAIEQGQFTAAIGFLGSAERQFAGRWEAAALRAAVYARTADWSQAAQAISLALQTAPEEKKAGLRAALLDIRNQAATNQRQ
jgi:Flp pilus assembly protein TadD